MSVNPPPTKPETGSGAVPFTSLFNNPNECRHYTGHHAKTCRKGHRYTDIQKRDELGLRGAFLRLPCRWDGPTVCPCPDLDRYSDAEVKEQEEATLRELDATLLKIDECRDAILFHVRERKHSGVRDSCPCPICKTGELHYQYAGNYNGHIQARCSTERCIQWGE